MWAGVRDHAQRAAVVGVACHVALVVDIDVLLIGHAVEIVNTEMPDGADHIFLQGRLADENDLLGWHHLETDFRVGIHVEKLIGGACDGRLLREPEIMRSLVVVAQHVLQRVELVLILGKGRVGYRLAHEEARAHVDDVPAVVRNDLVIRSIVRSLLFVQDVMLAAVVALQAQLPQFRRVVPEAYRGDVLQGQFCFCRENLHSPNAPLLNRLILCRRMTSDRL